MKSNLKNLNSRFLILDSRKRLYPAPASFRSGAGFTLLELLVVIAIISILIALGMISYSTAQKKSRDAKRSSDLKEIQNALETYHAVTGNYPDGATYNYPEPLEGDPNYFTGGNVPTDPKSGASYIDNPYTTTAYTICADLELVGSHTGSEEDTCVSNLQ